MHVFAVHCNMPLPNFVGIQHGISNAIMPFRGTHLSVCLHLTVESNSTYIFCVRSIGCVVHPINIRLNAKVNIYSCSMFMGWLLEGFAQHQLALVTRTTGAELHHLSRRR